MKRFLLVILFFSSAMFAFPQSKVTLDNAVKDFAAELLANIPSGGRVAVISFETDKRDLMVYFIDSMVNRLSEKNGKDVGIYERRNIETIQKELDFSMTGYVDDAAAQRIGHFIGVDTVVYGSMAAAGNNIRMSIRVASVETAEIKLARSYDLRLDGRLKGLLGNAQNTTGNAANDKYLYFGGRAGLSLGFYGNGGGLADKTVYPSQSIAGVPAFDGSLFISASLSRFLEIQIEAMITNDSFELNSGNTRLFTVSYNSLMMPLLAKFVYRPSWYMVHGYAGAYLSVPLGQMEVRHNNGSYTADFSLLGGLMTGGGLGIRLGPGTVLADIRYAGDLGFVTSDYNGSREISKRNKVYFSLGYEFGVLPK
jgi:TolB-like protein